MQSPHYPRHNEVPWLDQRCCDQRQGGREEPDEDEEDRVASLFGGSRGMSYAVSFVD